MLAADAEEAEVEQAERRAERPLPGHAGELEVLADDLAGLGQAGGDGEHAVVLGLVPLLAPDRVVQVLAAAGVVGADGLDVPVGRRADPHVLPRRRDHEGLAPGDVVGTERLAVVVDVGEALAPASARPAGTVGRDAAQAGIDRRRYPAVLAANRRAGQPKFSKYRLGVGPRWPWYFDPVAPLPYGRSAGVVISMKLIWPIFMPG